MMYITNLLAKFRKTAKDEKGASMVEYALLVALIAMVAVAAVGTLGTATRDKLATFGTDLGK